jgi:CBS-domain-containing membrane protein
MTKDPVTIETEATLAAAMEQLGNQGLRRLLVVDPDGNLTGILSWTDLVPHRSERGLGRVVSQLCRRGRVPYLEAWGADAALIHGPNPDTRKP